MSHMTKKQPEKNPAAVALGKRGGRARWDKATPEERLAHSQVMTEGRRAKRAPKA